DPGLQARAFEDIARLGPHGHAGAIAAVRELFHGAGPCREAIWALAALGAPGLVAEVVPLCEHEDAGVRSAALRALAHADGPDAPAAAALCRALDRDEGNEAVDALSDRPAALALVAGEILARVRGERPSRHHIRMVRRLGLSGDEEAELLCR